MRQWIPSPNIPTDITPFTINRFDELFLGSQLSSRGSISMAAYGVHFSSCLPTYHPEQGSGIDTPTWRL